MSAEPDDLDMRAAEYVLGLLSPVETDAVRRELARNPALRLAVAGWETRLTPLATALPPQTPPAFLWRRIEDDLAARKTTVTPLLKRAPFWQAATATLAALAAGLAVLLLNTPPPARHFAAAIAPMQGPVPTWLAETRADGALVLTAFGQTDRPAGKDLELWALPAGATKPTSLGVLPSSGSFVVAAADLPRDHLQLLVSLEPTGGSPTGQPTGPVLYAGALTQTE